MTLEAHGPLQERIERLTAKIQRDPDNAELYLDRGELHRHHRDWTAAEADYDRAVQIRPALALVDLARGRMFLDAGRPERAMAALDRFLARQPDHGEALLERARALVRLNQPLAAAADFTSAIERLAEPTPEPYLERAQALAAGGPAHAPEALRGLEEGMARLGPLVVLQLQALDLELVLERYDLALVRLEQIAAPSRRKETYLERKGEILERAGRSEEARAAFLAALAAIKALPFVQRKTPAASELEARLRARLEGPAAHPFKEDGKRKGGDP